MYLSSALAENANMFSQVRDEYASIKMAKVKKMENTVLLLQFVQWVRSTALCLKPIIAHYWGKPCVSTISSPPWIEFSRQAGGSRQFLALFSLGPVNSSCPGFLRLSAPSSQLRETAGLFLNSPFLGLIPETPQGSKLGQW